MMPDEFYMNCALAEARAAAADGEIPVGAVIVSESGRILGRGHNLTERLADVTAHAEIQAITAAATTIGGKYLDGCTLYVTLEPCIMCAGAIGHSRVARVVVGAADPKGGYTRVMEPRAPLHPRTTLTTGVMADECAELLREFFQSRRH